MYGRIFEETGGTYRAGLEATYASGNTVVAIYHGTGSRQGRTLDQRFALLFEIEHGQAVRLTGLPADQDAADAFLS
jgi:ketosteroid isomerase-like protein